MLQGVRRIHGLELMMYLCLPCVSGVPCDYFSVSSHEDKYTHTTLSCRYDCAGSRSKTSAMFSVRGPCIVLPITQTSRKYFGLFYKLVHLVLSRSIRRKYSSHVCWNSGQLVTHTSADFVGRIYGINRSLPFASGSSLRSKSIRTTKSGVYTEVKIFCLVIAVSWHWSIH